MGCVVIGESWEGMFGSRAAGSRSTRSRLSVSSVVV